MFKTLRDNTNNQDDQDKKSKYREAAKAYRPETPLSIIMNLILTLTTGIYILILLSVTPSCQHFYKMWLICDALVLIMSVPVNYLNRYLELKQDFQKC